MLTVHMEGHQYSYQVADVIRLFYGVCQMENNHLYAAVEARNITIYSRLSEGVVTTMVSGDVPDFSADRLDSISESREVKRQLYQILTAVTKKTYPWGSLTGIRPTIIAREVNSIEELVKKYFVSEDKAKLAVLTAQYEDRILLACPKTEASIYIGVPFCPSRCSYCSFISADASMQLSLLRPYVDAVLHEMKMFFTIYRPQITSLYIGGGTPTTFDDDTFRYFLENVFSIIKSSDVPEITVEAGRPDTVTVDKLLVMKEVGVNRICINSQTLSDRTLVSIGRKHTARDFTLAFDLAVKTGFQTISSDLIAGLPGETLQDFSHSLDTILSMRPENITIHTLSKKKRASLTRENMRLVDNDREETIAAMLIHAEPRLRQEGYLPYYMYRQKDSIGGYENVGYTVDGHACKYNVAMMSDQRNIIAFGAGSISKRLYGQKQLMRCPNVKDPHEYISRIDEMIDRKRGFFVE